MLTSVPDIKSSKRSLDWGYRELTTKFVKLILRIINQIEDFFVDFRRCRIWQVGASDYGRLRSIPVAWNRDRLTGAPRHVIVDREGPCGGASTQNAAAVSGVQGSYLQEMNPELYPSSKPM